MSLCVDKSHKGLGYKEDLSAENLIAEMYWQNNPKMLAHIKDLQIISPETCEIRAQYELELGVLHASTGRQDIRIDLLTHYLVVMPKQMLRGSGFCASERTFFPQLSCEFLREYLHAPKVDKAEFGFLKFALDKLDPNLRKIPIMSSLISRSGLELNTRGYLLSKLRLRLKDKFGLLQKPRTNPRLWETIEGQTILGPETSNYWKKYFASVENTLRHRLVVHDSYLAGQFLEHTGKRAVLEA